MASRNKSPPPNPEPCAIANYHQAPEPVSALFPFRLLDVTQDVEGLDFAVWKEAVHRVLLIGEEREHRGGPDEKLRSARANAWLDIKELSGMLTVHEARYADQYFLELREEARRRIKAGKK